MRKLSILAGAMACCALTVGGCPSANPAAMVLAGNWTGTAGDGTLFSLTFNAAGILVEVSTTGADDVTVTANVPGASSTVEGSDVTIEVNVGDQAIVYSGVLSTDENTITGSLAAELLFGDTVEVTIPAGSFNLVRVIDETANDNDNDNGASNDNMNDNSDDNENDNGDGTVEMTFTAMLTGDQEVPAVETEGSGKGTFTLSEDMTMLTFEVTASGLSGPIVGAHFHAAPAGENGAVVFDLTDLVEETEGEVTIMGTIDVAEIDVDMPVEDLLGGNLYVNLHTEANSGGEIRGQVIVDADDDDGEGDNDNGNDDNMNAGDDDNGNDNANENENDNSATNENDNDNMNANDNGTGDDMNDNSAPLTGDVAAGETFVADNCSACHGADGASGAQPNIQGKSASEISEKISAGGAHSGITLTDQDAADAAAYLGSF